MADAAEGVLELDPSKADWPMAFSCASKGLYWERRMLNTPGKAWEETIL